MDNHLLMQQLMKTAPFHYLSAEEATSVMQYGETMRYQHRDIILHQGTLGPGLFVILSGKTMVTVRLLGRGEMKLADLLPGQFFGEVNLLDNIPCTATVASTKETVCFILKTSVFDMFYLAFPTIRYHINCALIEGVLLRQKQIIKEIEVLSKRVKRRVVRLSSANTMRAVMKKKRITKAAKRKELSYLDQLPVFTSFFNREEIHHIMRIANIVEAQHDCFLIKKRDRSESYFFILTGSVKASIPTDTGGVKFAVFGPNTFICSTTIFNQQASFFTYETCGSATMLEIAHDDLLAIKEHYPLLWYKLHDMGCRYITSLQKRLNIQIVRMSSEIPETMIHLAR